MTGKGFRHGADTALSGSPNLHRESRWVIFPIVRPWHLRCHQLHPRFSMKNLLSDSVIRADYTDNSRRCLSLPEVYEAMLADRIIGFPALRSHQRHAWHAFLAQLAVIALVRSGRDKPPARAAEWQNLIRALTPEFRNDEPWRLVVEDSSKPAFMQCPAPNGLVKYKKEVRAPDDLDLLVTSKNHDMKSSIGIASGIDDWIFALINCQTMNGYSGLGNHGIARMSGGFGSRPLHRTCPGGGRHGCVSCARYSYHAGVSMILLGPGSMVSHDALRLMARHGTALAAVGVDGVRLYTAPPLMSGRSGLARIQARCWSDPEKRLMIVRRMYAWRLGEVLPNRDISALRGIEGARMRETYRLVARTVGIDWNGRRYDRMNPARADLPNQALNHASSAVEAAAAIAVCATATIPQLGFIHEEASQAFVLDISDLFRDTVLIPSAFRAAKHVVERNLSDIERVTRREVGSTLSKQRIIPKMIQKIKNLFDNSGY